MKTLVAPPAFTDNYIWMIHDGLHAVVVDPGDAAPVHRALDELELGLAAILVTHHHHDHVGGVNALRPRLQGPVYGHAREAIPQPFEPLVDGQLIGVLGQQLLSSMCPDTSRALSLVSNRGRQGPDSFFAATRCSPPVVAAFSKVRRPRWLNRCSALIDAGQPTLPSTLALELQINPFLRCGSASVIASARSHGATAEEPVSVFAAPRSWKDQFR